MMAMLSAAPAEEYHIGVLNPGDEAATRAAWADTLAHLNKSVPGASFVLDVAPREELRSALHQNRVAFVITDPTMVLQESRLLSVAASTRRFEDRSVAYTGGALFCPLTHEKIHGPGDVKGRTLATTSRESLVDWMAVAYRLQLAGLKLDTDFKEVLQLQSPAAVADAVRTGRADAGALRGGELERLEAAGVLPVNAMRMLYFDVNKDESVAEAVPFGLSTELYPEWIFAASDHAPADIVRRIGTALFAMAPSSGPGGLLTLNGWTAVPSLDATRRCMQALRVPPFEKYGEEAQAALVKQSMPWVIGGLVALGLMAGITLKMTALNRAMNREIAQRREAEVALRASMKRFEHIVKCSMDWIWELDPHCRFTYTSSAVESMLGYTPEELLKMSLADILSQADNERLEGGKLLFNSGRNHVFRERVRLRTKAGRIVIHEITAEPVGNVLNVLTGYRGVNRDITSQVRLVQL